jgi:hypothetical protein
MKYVLKDYHKEIVSPYTDKKYLNIIFPLFYTEMCDIFQKKIVHAYFAILDHGFTEGELICIEFDGDTVEYKCTDNIKK